MNALLNVVSIDSKPAKVRCGSCVRDTAGKMVSPCPKHRRKYDGNGIAALSEKQVVAFLGAAQSDVRANALFRLMFGHGLRVSEVARLRFSDINLEEGTVRICPLKKKKAVSYLEPLLPGGREALTAYLAVRPSVGTDTPLFVSRKHLATIQPMHRSYILKVYVELAKRANLPARLWHPHAIRHSTAMRMYQQMRDTNCVDMPTIQFALRHDSPASTSVYAKPDVQSVAATKTHLFGSLLVAG
jgi:integrase